MRLVHAIHFSAKASYQTKQTGSSSPGGVYSYVSAIYMVHEPKAILSYSSDEAHYQNSTIDSDQI